MAEYIDKQAAIEAIDESLKRVFVLPVGKSIMDKIPAADVRPVVTCAECDWHVDCGYHFCNRWCLPCPDNADFYCAYGERPTAGP